MGAIPADAVTGRPGPSPAGAPTGNRVPSAVLGTCLLVFTEVMFFCGLISAYLVLRAGAAIWPPLDQPRLPVAVTAVNTAVLLASGVAMWSARRAAARGDAAATSQRLSVALVTGATFLAIQGYEWVRLVGFGLTAASSLYGGLFYTLIGAHGLHVAAGLVALAITSARARSGLAADRTRAMTTAMAIYWLFVVGVWPVLYVLVYLW